MSTIRLPITPLPTGTGVVKIKPKGKKNLKRRDKVAMGIFKQLHKTTLNTDLAIIEAYRLADIALQQ